MVFWARCGGGERFRYRRRGLDGWRRIILNACTIILIILLPSCFHRLSLPHHSQHRPPASSSSSVLGLRSESLDKAIQTLVAEFLEVSGSALGSIGDLLAYSDVHRQFNR